MSSPNLRAVLMKSEVSAESSAGAPAHDVQSSVLLAHGASPWVGECTDARHPTLLGRAKVRWTEPDGRTCERWLPMLLSMTVRAADRVLMLKPANWDEPVIVGVLDGFAQRPERPAHGGPVLELARDEALQIHAATGERVLELTIAESGPVVRLLDQSVGLHLPGALSISAESISFKARQGEVTLIASDDVIVQGATVRLN